MGLLAVSHTCDCCMYVCIYLRMYECMYVCIGFMAIISAMVLCARFHDSLPSVSVRRVHVVFSTAGLKSGGKSYSKARDTAALTCDSDSRRKRTGSNPRLLTHEHRALTIASRRS